MAPTVTTIAGTPNEPPSTRYSETGTDNAALTVVVPNDSGRYDLLSVMVSYDVTPTSGAITLVTYNQLAGGSANFQLSASAANAKNTFYQPERPLRIVEGDTVTVLAPAGGVGKIPSINIDMRKPAS